MQTVLIVDDSPFVREMVRYTLHKGGYAVEEAENGQEALDKLKSIRVDLVITDLNMPVKDGMALIRALRADSAMKTKPILMLTTAAFPAQGLEGWAAGATGWIVKPFNAEKLLATVARSLP